MKYWDRNHVDNSLITKVGFQPLLDKEIHQFDNCFARLEELAQEASSLGVRLMVDAEQTYFQAAIDVMTRRLQRRYNKQFPTIFTTLQCYLKGSQERLREDLICAERHGFLYGLKIVRGAYMVQEAIRAKDLNYDNPVFSSIEETHANYDACVRDSVAYVAQEKASIMVATHNENSVKAAVEQMKEHNVPMNGEVHFGQLLGMADHISFTLGQNGYAAYKYVPYGPVIDVAAYLIRRMEENSTMLGSDSVEKERQMLSKELKRRRQEQAQNMQNTSSTPSTHSK